MGIFSRKKKVEQVEVEQVEETQEQRIDKLISNNAREYYMCLDRNELNNKYKMDGTNLDILYKKGWELVAASAADYEYTILYFKKREKER